jgi:hypothetical protein
MVMLENCGLSHEMLVREEVFSRYCVYLWFSGQVMMSCGGVYIYTGLESLFKPFNFAYVVFWTIIPTGMRANSRISSRSAGVRTSIYGIVATHEASLHNSTGAFREDVYLQQCNKG